MTPARRPPIDGIWNRWVAGELDAIRSADRWRTPRTLISGTPETVLAAEGRHVVSFASNDYLGLSQHPAVKAAATAAVERWGAGSGSSRLVVGSRTVHDELEDDLAAWRHTEAAVVLPTGYAANLAVATVFGDAGTLICSDELNHASIIDGVRLARAEVAVYRHGDLDHLDALLAAAGDRRVMVVTDRVFSMDGDVAPMAGLVERCRRHGALLVLDEAHSVLDPEPALEGVEVLRVGTLSKTLGSLGGFVASSRSNCELLVNRARPYIFTTAPTPGDTAAARAALEIARSPEGAALRHRLRAHIDRLRAGHPSPIIPIVLGREAEAMAAADGLLERGLLVPAIRPPTVAPGTSRLRVALSAGHTEQQVTHLLAALGDLVGAGPGAGALP